MGSAGYLARPFEVEDLAHGITSLLTDDDLRQRMTEQAPKRASALFDARQIADRYIDLYQQTRSIYGLAVDDDHEINHSRSCLVIDCGWAINRCVLL